MIKIYGMITCPDCSYLMDQIAGLKDKYEYVEIGEHVLKMKEFLRLRDSDENVVNLKECKRSGRCWNSLLCIRNGRISLNPSDAGLEANPR